MKRCSRCVMPESVPGITFDENGVCTFCLSYKQFVPKGKDAMVEIIKSAPKKGGKYDCLVPLSGGRDSSYVLYFAKKVLGLEPLALNFDNEFRVEQALINMTTICKALDVDFLSIRSQRDIGTQIVKSSLRSAPTIIDNNLCRHCAFGFRSISFRMAENEKIPVILWGESEAESTARMTPVIFESGKYKPKYYRKLLNFNFYLSEYFAFLQRVEFKVKGNPLFSRCDQKLVNPNIKQIKVYDYIDWDRTEIKKVLMDELGWRKPEGHVSTWRSDCALHPYVNYCYYKMFGCTKDCLGYCNMINSGKLERSVALEQEVAMIAQIDKGLDELLMKQVGLKESEVNRLLSV